MYITLINEFHNAEARVRVADYHAMLTHSQYARAARNLCGNTDCQCQTVKRVIGQDGERIVWEPDCDANQRTTIKLYGID